MTRDEDNEADGLFQQSAKTKELLMTKLKVAFVQTSPVFGRVKENVNNAVALINKALGKGANLVVLPELFSTGYQFKTQKEALRYAEDARLGYAAARLTEEARKGNAHIVAGMDERDEYSAYNSSILVGPGGVMGVYRKAHLFWNEKKIFAPGDTAPQVYSIGKARVGMMICFDWLFPEVARTLALKGADIICQPSNLVLPYCPQAMITRSIENRVFTITANRVGTEERINGKPLRFIGQSQIVAPNGDVIWRAGGGREAVKTAEIDVAEARNKNITPLNDVFEDRRTDLYSL